MISLSAPAIVVLQQFSSHINTSSTLTLHIKYYSNVIRPGDNPFYSNIDSMPDIRPRRKSIPLVSELVSDSVCYTSEPTIDAA
ncbi:hypothetical protein SK128_009186 [Halocaridina rubra]|uniref:Uncharacterized protein n=1 Tax=Halocaridina rubra TaxID=373956 RepID=A0AAN8XBQ2_HALRR